MSDSTHGLQANSNNMSGARLDRFYVKKGNRGRFFSSIFSVRSSLCIYCSF